MAEDGTRLFFALWPEATVAGRLHEAARLAQARCGGRLMRRETLHLTLAFLGDVAAARQADAEAAAAMVAGAGCVLAVDRLGCWKHNRIVWAGCSSLPPALGRLAQDLGARLRAAGFALEARPFAAHATLLRNAHCAPDALPQLPAIDWAVRDFALVASRRDADGARYEVLRRWPLAAPID